MGVEGIPSGIMIDIFDGGSSIMIFRPHLVNATRRDSTRDGRQEDARRKLKFILVAAETGSSFVDLNVFELDFGTWKLTSSS